MRLLFILLVCSSPLLTYSQIEIQKKSELIVQIKGGEWLTKLEKDSAKGFSVYSFVFRNNKYTELVDVKVLGLDEKKDVKELGEAFKAAQKIDVGDRVTTPRYFITKSKSMGFTGYTLFYGDAYCELSSKMAQKLIDAIDKL